MKEAKSLARIGVECADMRPHRLEHHKRADDVGVNEGTRSIDRTIDVRLGGKIDHRVRPVIRKYPRHGVAIRDVGADERHAPIFQGAVEVEQAPRVGELVDHNDAVGGAIERVPNEVGTDEARAACDEERCHEELRTKN